MPDTLLYSLSTLLALCFSGATAVNVPINQYKVAAPLSIVCPENDQFCYVGLGLPAGSSSGAIVRFFPGNLSIDAAIPLKSSEFVPGQLTVDPSGKQLYALVNNYDPSAVFQGPSTFITVDLASFRIAGRTPFVLTAWTRVSSSRVVASGSDIFAFSASDYPPGLPAGSDLFGTAYFARLNLASRSASMTLTQFEVPTGDIQSVVSTAASRAHVVDLEGKFVVYALATKPIWLVKVDVSSWEIVQTRRIDGSPTLTSHVMAIEPTGNFAFIATQTFIGYQSPTINSVTYKIRLDDLTVVANATVEKQRGNCLSMVIESTGTYGIFAYSSGSLARIRLSDLTYLGWGSFGLGASAAPMAGTATADKTTALFAVQGNDQKSYLSSYQLYSYG